MKDWIINFLFILGIIVIFLLAVFLIYYFKHDGTKCLIDPIAYYELKEEVYCYCSNQLII